jgi:hypothetical protein
VKQLCKAVPKSDRFEMSAAYVAGICACVPKLDQNLPVASAGQTESSAFELVPQLLAGKPSQKFGPHRFCNQSTSFLAGLLAELNAKVRNFWNVKEPFSTVRNNSFKLQIIQSSRRDASDQQGKLQIKHHISPVGCLLV